MDTLSQQGYNGNWMSTSSQQGYNSNARPMDKNRFNRVNGNNPVIQENEFYNPMDTPPQQEYRGNTIPMDQNRFYYLMSRSPQHGYNSDNYQEEEVIFLREEKPKSLSQKVAYSGFSFLLPPNDDIDIIQSEKLQTPKRKRTSDKGRSYLTDDILVSIELIIYKCLFLTHSLMVHSLKILSLPADSKSGK